MAQRETSMTDDGKSPTTASRVPLAVSSPADGTRLGVYAALGASVAAVPLPWIPDALVRRVRGALVHDIPVRHGLSLTGDARDALAEPSVLDAARCPTEVLPEVLIGVPAGAPERLCRRLDAAFDELLAQAG